MTLSTATPTYNQAASEEEREMTEVGQASEEAQEQTTEESQVYAQDYAEGYHADNHTTKAEATGHTVTVTRIPCVTIGSVLLVGWAALIVTTHLTDKTGQCALPSHVLLACR
jgi:hypothetical protein